MAVGHARLNRALMDRFEIRSIPQPLLQQQGGGGAVQTSAAIPCQPMAFRRGPAAAVFIHPGDGQGKSASETLPIPLAVRGLVGGFAVVIQWKSDHEANHRACVAELAEDDQIRFKAPPLQSC